MQASDNQFIYDNAVPPTVHSVDHGHFFSGGPEWNEATLQAAAPTQIEPALDGSVTWTDDLLAEVRDGLAGATDQLIANAVCRPPDSWGMTTAERTALASYLSSRRDVMVKILEERMTPDA
jgi:hypothetical protein